MEHSQNQSKRTLLSASRLLLAYVEREGATLSPAEQQVLNESAYTIQNFFGNDS